MHMLFFTETIYILQSEVHKPDNKILVVGNIFAE